VVLADLLAAIGQIASLVAAGAAVVAIYFARQTVAEAKNARSEATVAHAEQMTEALRLLEATTAAHTTEMAARDRDFEARLVMQRMAQLGVITDILRELTDIAREEQHHPPLKTESNQPLSRIPSRLAQLNTALSIFQRLGGHPLKHAGELARGGYNRGTPLMQVLGMAQGGLQEAVAQADAHIGLELPDQSLGRG